MKTHFSKTTLTLALALTGLAATAQAGDIKPLHHVCTNVGNTPALPAGVLPNVAEASRFLSSVGANVVTDTDTLRFVCPATHRGSFEYQVRDRQLTGVVDGVNGTDVRATAAGTLAPGNSTDPAYGTHASAWGNFALTNTVPATGVLVNVTRVNNNRLSPRSYELCVQCYSGANETGTHVNVLGSLVTNQ